MLVFSHLRWSWVYQRPQHLMTRAAQHRRVFFVEEPIFDTADPHMQLTSVAPGVTVVTPHLIAGRHVDDERDTLRSLLADMIRDHAIRVEILWYFTPSAMPFTVDIAADVVVYDCMDELSGFVGAPAALQHNERQLMSRADVVFTGGWSLYDAKHSLHANVHAMPSGVDLDHFRQARRAGTDCEAQAGVPRPRVGYAGVLDERLDLDLIAAVVTSMPSHQFVFAGPVTKIDPATLPHQPNVHFLGLLPYALLPEVMGGWDVAWMPFAQNSATRFISPTKTPEYLAAGLPVVSTPIRDVVRSWGDEELVTIVSNADECVAAINRLSGSLRTTASVRRIDHVLAFHSWDALWFRMSHLLEQSRSNAA